MKDLSRILFTVSRVYLLIASFTVIVSGQTTTATPTKTLKEQRQEQNIPGRQYNDNTDLSNAIRRPVSKEMRELMERWAAMRIDIKNYTGMLKKMIVAPPEYKNRYVDLIKDEKLNLIRIYPDKNCDLLEEKQISAAETERCAGLVQFGGGGSKYSFRKNTNVIYQSMGADISFTGDAFVTGNTIIKSDSMFRESAMGIIGEIGSIDLRDINLASAASKILTEFEPNENSARFENQNKIIENGVNSNGFNYSSRAPLKLNATYVLRSVIYTQMKKEVVRNRQIEYIKTDKLKMLRDVSVAFTVVGQEPDGSVILLWKKLK